MTCIPSRSIKASDTLSVAPQFFAKYPSIMETTSLGKLPGELRNQIYELVLIRSYPVAVHVFECNQRIIFKLSTKNMDALLRVCKQARRECAGIFFANSFQLIWNDSDILDRGHHILALFVETASAVGGAKSIKEVVIASTLLQDCVAYTFGEWSWSKFARKNLNACLGPVKKASQRMSYIDRLPTQIVKLRWDLMVVWKREFPDLHLDVDIRDFRKRSVDDMSGGYFECVEWLL